MATLTHDPNITFTVALDPQPVQAAGFGVVALLVDQAANSLNGARRIRYSSYAAAVADQGLGYISTGTLAAVLVAFSQRPKPAEFVVARVDLGGGETYATGLTALIAADSDFYGVCINSRTQAIVKAVADLVETNAKRMLFCFQDDDTSWLDASVPAAFSLITGYERTIGVYHTTDAQWGDVGWMVCRLVHDPDERSAPWSGAPVRGITAYTTVPTAAQRLIAIDDNHINLGLPFGGQTFVMDPGVNLAGRPIDEVLSADWYVVRVTEDIAELVVEHADRGEKVVVDATGQAKIGAIHEGRLAQGERVGHFVATSVVMEDITDDDRTNREIRATIRGQFAVSARLFDNDAFFSRLALDDEPE